jgi:hypothetical protein
VPVVVVPCTKVVQVAPWQRSCYGKPLVSVEALTQVPAWRWSRPSERSWNSRWCRVRREGRGTGDGGIGTEIACRIHRPHLVAVRGRGRQAGIAETGAGGLAHFDKVHTGAAYTPFHPIAGHTYGIVPRSAQIDLRTAYSRGRRRREPRVCVRRPCGPPAYSYRS